MVELIYGRGLRLMECLRLRIKDVDLETTMIYVHTAEISGKTIKSHLDD